MTEEDFRRDAMWKLFQEHCTHMRHHELQRSTVAATMIAIASALLGAVTFDKSLSISDLPLLAIVIALGIFGALFSAKHFERSAMHMERARGYRDALDAELKGRPLDAIKRSADSMHNKVFPKLHRLRVHKFWIALYTFVSFVGLILAMFAIWHPIFVL